jgi:hypothetical protein
VWFKHLTLLSEIGCNSVPSVVVELGPGGSLGAGCAALFSGANCYIGVDAYSLADGAQNSTIASDLLRLFQDRAPFRPKGWPDFSCHLDDRWFPSNILTESVLNASLSPSRVETILRDASRPGLSGKLSMVNYRAPWRGVDAIEANSVDLVFSHSVLEHIADLPLTVNAAYHWLKPGGLMSHQFDLQSHGITRAWDGHRAFSDALWRIVLGKRRWLINRLSYTAIIEAIAGAGFDIVKQERCIGVPTLPRAALKGAWTACSDEDLYTMGGFVQARKTARSMAMPDVVPGSPPRQRSL